MKSTYGDPFETRDQYCVITELLLSNKGFKNTYVYFKQFEELNVDPNILYSNPNDIVKTTKYYQFRITLENGKEYHICLDENPLSNQDTLVFDKFILLYKLELLEN